VFANYSLNKFAAFATAQMKFHHQSAHQPLIPVKGAIDFGSSKVRIKP
jgi:hypothetical protein